MIELSQAKIGFALTGSFCTFERAFFQAEALRLKGAELIPIMSFNASSIDTRFGSAKEHIDRIEEICKNKVIKTIEAAEPIGPKKLADIIVVCPCTGNTCSKLAMSVTDTPVTMAVKSHIRNRRPVVIALASNDSLAGSMKNIGMLMNMKNYYFVPFYQDDCINKPTSAVCDFTKVVETVEAALNKKQIQPILC